MDRYGNDVLSGDWRAPSRGRSRSIPVALGMVVEDVSGYVGEVIRVEKAGGTYVMHLEDRQGRSRGFPLGSGFLVDGEPVTLTPPARQAAPSTPNRTASGSVAVANTPARVARGSRIFVEGRHDAELVEKVWGDDLRIEGVVVEYLEGVDDLADVIRQFAPTRGRRLGILVDHLVPGTKEARIAAAAQALPQGRDHVLIVGHPYIDVWQSVRPERLGLKQWPVIPKGQSWKHGILRELGLPHATQADVARGWKLILAQVRTYADLEPSLLGRVEELIDFVTDPAQQ